MYAAIWLNIINHTIKTQSSANIVRFCQTASSATETNLGKIISRYSTCQNTIAPSARFPKVQSYKTIYKPVVVPGQVSSLFMYATKWLNQY